MNTVYRKSNLGEWLRHFRVNSFDESVRSQQGLANRLHTDQKKISNIEHGAEPRLEFASEWCKATGWHEGWDIVAHIYQLDPFSVPPIHQELSKRLSDAILNMKKQMLQAWKALEDLEEVNNSRRPTKPVEINHILKKDACDLFDLIPATKTILYSSERDIGLDIEDITSEWTMGCLSDDLIIPTLSELEKELASAR
ncbi:helix-turn-helix domain-containing protein [Salibacterium halotolerans]|uniref:Uncharacterized protein n=1 Tax=Salibacterium halotolerans TaxID=1884432 RepID=A0A1I5MIV1_9BACI|nr:helix-turn-helix transcriptional regulator [Salibacterium halotolerans]SFP09534.1 hypothetical protein SAMN05518683_102253 [Salibacterium halotolerans]